MVGAREDFLQPNDGRQPLADVRDKANLRPIFGRNRANRATKQPGTECAPGSTVILTNQGPLVLAIFFLTQFLDGALTYWGVSRFGMDVELNFYLAWFMGAVGPGVALLAAKLLACGCGLVLFYTSSLKTLAAATGWCIGFALIPWILLATVFA
jgi:hypothetical protein